MTAATCSDILVCRHIFGLGGGGGGGPLAPHNARAPGCGVCANLVHADCWHYLHAIGTYRAQTGEGGTPKLQPVLITPAQCPQ